MKLKSHRPEDIFGPLLIRLVAAFERYLRQIVEYVVHERTAGAKMYDYLAPTLVNRNLVLTGRLLSGLENARDHLTIDVHELVQNLASCSPGSTSFKLNAQAFYAGIAGASPAHVEKALESVDLTGWWDAVGSHSALVGVLGTKGARPTGDRAREKLKDLSRWRNNLAHGGDTEIIVSEAQLRDAVDFFDAFCAALDTVVRRALKR